MEKQERVVLVVDAEEQDEKAALVAEGISVLDFDLLCSTVALQTQGKWIKSENEVHEAEEFGGVLRMWEGRVLDCFDDPAIALESACCPCYRFGKNMRRIGFGPCFIQGIIYFILVMGILLNLIAFIVSKRHCFLYLAIAFIISFGMYLGFFRRQIRRKFNIRGSDSLLDDCAYHLMCPCCTLCQESRTLEMNNVQDGTWHGRGDTICIGSYGERSKAFFQLHHPSIIKSPDPCTMQKSPIGTYHS